MSSIADYLKEAKAIEAKMKKLVAQKAAESKPDSAKKQDKPKKLDKKVKQPSKDDKLMAKAKAKSDKAHAAWKAAQDELKSFKSGSCASSVKSGSSKKTKATKSPPVTPGKRPYNRTPEGWPWEVQCAYIKRIEREEAAKYAAKQLLKLNKGK